ncbi:CoB--CoM heterodisulfide reductase iron-sulfur subunit B family protein [Desulfovibrio sp. Huiquan2017]|uniref:CoB--CoM heterodisulfide reductase iron-sulfur subunit B family protein n=1 Tax=Desulfovibrio sp. Huiquan2017 TaxID=2816861 RepID=UPI001A911318|nr:CoB--CoM heterodisulfide reductase iron-sulfur subunit B family protein [Desulfovibrio sp. Huiquan2017]
MSLCYAYYPGCSGLGTSLEYDISTRALCRNLGIELVDIPDWNCCGSTPAHAVDHLLSACLVGRNLGIADDMAEARELDGIITPCPSCLKNLKTTQYRLADPEFHRKVELVVGRPLRADLPIKSVLQVVVEDLGLQALAQLVKAPLAGLKVVPYYGCIMVRPPRIMQFDDPENPMALDNLLTELGAEVLPFPLKTDCCGASLGTTRKDVIAKLSGRILDAAEEAGADAIVTACPLCQMNLDMRQSQINKANHSGHNMPVFYYSQLAGLAAGQGETSTMLDKLCVSPRPLLAALAGHTGEGA